MSGLSVRCRKCRGLVRVRIETDGRGKVVEVPEAHRCPPKQRREWVSRVDQDRRRGCICQRCDRSVEGKPKVALYCAEHRQQARGEAQQRYQSTQKARQRLDDWRERNRVKTNAAARRYARKMRKQRAVYKREWRKLNPDKVRMQKRRYALSGRARDLMRRRREAIAAGIKAPPVPTRRNARGERLCLRDDCQAVVSGRAKLCADCRAGRTVLERAA